MRTIGAVELPSNFTIPLYDHCNLSVPTAFFLLPECTNMDSTSSIDQLISIAGRIKTILGPTCGSIRPLQLANRLPDLQRPDPTWLLPVGLQHQRNAGLQSRVISVLFGAINKAILFYNSSYRRTIGSMVSVAEFGTKDDDEIERTVLRLYEQAFQRYLSSLKETVERCLAQTIGPQSSARKAGGFNEVSYCQIFLVQALITVAGHHQCPRGRLRSLSSPISTRVLHRRQSSRHHSSTSESAAQQTAQFR